MLNKEQADKRIKQFNTKIKLQQEELCDHRSNSHKVNELYKKIIKTVDTEKITSNNVKFIGE